MSKKTKTALTTEVDTLFADNSTKQITPAKLRQNLKNIIDSYFNALDDATIAGLFSFSQYQSYLGGQGMIYNGAIYKAKEDTLGPFDAAKWEKVTDPAGSCIPLIGTLNGQPVTGNVEISATKKFYSGSGGAVEFNAYEANDVTLTSDNGAYAKTALYLSNLYCELYGGVGMRTKLWANGQLVFDATASLVSIRRSSHAKGVLYKTGFSSGTSSAAETDSEYVRVEDGKVLLQAAGNNASLDGTGLKVNGEPVANQAYVDSKTTNLREHKGNTDCSANPNYPAGEVGDTYHVTVGGKIGGASGKTVDVGDEIVCKAINAGGDEATVGASWYVIESNRDQATESVKGIAKIATQAITDAGTNDTDFITALKLATWWSAIKGFAQTITANWNVLSVGKKINALGSVNTNQTINPATGTMTSLTATGNITINANSYTGSANYSTILTIQVTQDATGGRVITWGTGFEFSGGQKFVNSTSANAKDLFHFEWDGSVWVGINAIQDYKA